MIFFFRNFAIVDKSRISFNITEEMIMHWVSDGNEINWSGNVTLQISNSLGTDTKVILLPETEKIVPVEAPSELTYEILFWIILTLSCIYVIGNFIYRMWVHSNLYIDRVPYFSYFTKTHFGHIMQKWQLHFTD